jgi:hypothetical protein
MKNLFILIAMTIIFSSCASSRQKILDTSAVSMTKISLEKNQKLNPIGPVTGRYCKGTSQKNGEYGLMDEVINDAQTKSGADYITEVSFWLEGGCIVLEGTGQKITI